MLGLCLFMLGAFIGIFFMCCMQVSSSVDKQIEKYMKEENNEK